MVYCCHSLYNSCTDCTENIVSIVAKVCIEVLPRNELYSFCCYNYLLLSGFHGYELRIRCLATAYVEGSHRP
jgi:hypothetical protein